MKPYKRPELVMYGSVDVGLTSPPASSTACSCDCASHPSGGCDSVGFFSCGDLGAGEPCTTVTLGCTADCYEFDPPC